MKPVLSNSVIVRACCVVVLLSLIISIISFKQHWGVLPNVLDVLFSMTLLLPFALPASFNALVDLGVPSSGGGFIAFVLIYWSLVATLIWLLIKTRHLLFLTLFSLLLLLSAVKWQILATGMMGI